MYTELIPQPMHNSVQDVQVSTTHHSKMRSLIDDAAQPFRQFMEGLSSDALLGAGADKVVYPYGPNGVAAFMKVEQSPQAMKREFYERKLAATILPECVPEIHLASTKPPVLLIDKVIGAPVLDDRTKSASEFARKSTVRKFKDIGITIDPYYKNFVIDETGTAVYVDSIDIKTWDIPDIETAIDSLPDIRKQKAQIYLHRFLAQDSLSLQSAAQAL
jgi:hypothetical protein